MSTLVNDLLSIPVQVLINNGTNAIDVSQAFISLSLTSGVWDESGWFKLRGTLTLAAYVEGFAESFDCRLNPGRWAPGNVISIALWFGAWVPIPTRLRILRYPNRPWPGNTAIDIEIGGDADLLNYRAPEGDPTGIAYGTSTSATFLVNSALAKAGAPALALGNTIDGLSLPFSPEKQSGGSWITYAGQAAYAGGYVLWQQTDGAMRANQLATTGLEPFAHYVVGRDEADYVPETSQESPPEEVRVTGTTYQIDSVGDQSFVTTDTVDGITVRTTISYTARNTSSPTYVEKVEQPANVVLPNLFTTTELITATEDTRVQNYGIGNRLSDEVETLRQPVSAIFPNSQFGNPTQLAIAKRTTTAYTYDADNNTIARQTTLERAVISGITVTTAIAQITTERWEKVGNNEWAYSRNQVNRDNTAAALPLRRGPSTNNTPPATRYRPAEKQRLEKQFTGKATFTNPAGSGFAEKLWAITLPSGMGVSATQCQSRAQQWGAIRQGRQFAVAWSADITAAWLQNFTPVRRIDFTVDGRRTAYLVEALSIEIDARSAAIGGRGIELGAVGPGDPLPAPTPPFTVTLT